MLRDPWAVTGACIVAAFVALALLAPVITSLNGQDPYRYDLAALNESGQPLGVAGGVSWTHWFGVEPLTGRDLFAILAYGARTAILVGVGASIAAVAVGCLVGLASGYLGGWIDHLLGRIIDLLLSFPSLIFMIALTALVAPSFPKPLLIAVLIGFFGWPVVARVVRGQVLSLKSRDFVTAAQVIGAPASHVLLHLLLPNVRGTLIVYATILIPASIATEAALSFLGVGVPPPTPSWGRSIGDALGWFSTDPAYLAIAGGALFLLILGFTMLGDGVRSALDPTVSRTPNVRPGTAASEVKRSDPGR
ncbi:MAG: ABC transporter permease [Mycetocola sp.]